YATAVSVLTDEKYFQGNFEFLPQVRKHLTQPVLCKDFMIDPYQVYLARYYQADAILLMLSVLSDEEYITLSRLAGELQLDVLTEVSNPEELARAKTLKAPIVGINNRDLRDLSIDLNRTFELAQDLDDDVIVISESGIYHHYQVKSLAKVADAFLIGSALMSEDNLERAVRRVILGENKVCGLTRAQDAISAYEAGSVYGGLIFVPSSKRYIDLEHAKKVTQAAPLAFVGVFQNESIDVICDKASQLNLAAVQLHGDEDQAYVNQLRTALPKSCQIWKAYGVKDLLPTRLDVHVDRHVYDCKVGQQSGGTGQSFDWTLLDDLSAEHKQTTLLAGGISADNAQTAASYGCIGLDLNSGVEDAPGIKNQQKLKQAFAQIREF
ncbi:MAG: bifunctional indole-3-glycerol-phosphate synthase TrpC/phosphoribosylanthranilate isomerase TrpF, partial [Vibrio sp.]